MNIFSELFNLHNFHSFFRNARRYINFDHTIMGTLTHIKHNFHTFVQDGNSFAGVIQQKNGGQTRKYKKKERLKKKKNNPHSKKKKCHENREKLFLFENQKNSIFAKLKTFVYIKPCKKKGDNFFFLYFFFPFHKSVPLGSVFVTRKEGKNMSPK